MTTALMRAGQALWAACVFSLGCSSSSGGAPRSSPDAAAEFSDAAASGSVPESGDISDSSSAMSNVDAPTSTSVTATFVEGGVPYVAVDTIGVEGTDSVTHAAYAGVWIWNQAGACAFAQSGLNEPQNSGLLELEIANIAAGAKGVLPGDYPIVMTKESASYALYETTDSNCTVVTSELGQSGIITLDTVTPTRIAGSFDVVFVGGDHFAGSFSGPVCNFDMSQVGQNGASPGCPAAPDQ